VRVARQSIELCDHKPRPVIVPLLSSVLAAEPHQYDILAGECTAWRS
jgi:hypothetical protein